MTRHRSPGSRPLIQPHRFSVDVEEHFHVNAFERYVDPGRLGASAQPGGCQHRPPARPPGAPRGERDVLRGGLAGRPEARAGAPHRGGGARDRQPQLVASPGADAVSRRVPGGRGAHQGAAGGDHGPAGPRISRPELFHPARHGVGLRHPARDRPHLRLERVPDPTPRLWLARARPPRRTTSSAPPARSASTR